MGTFSILITILKLKKMHRTCCLIVFFGLTLSACLKPTAEDLLEVDLEFSALSREKGIKHAFLEYAADSAVMLQPDAMPLVGKKNIAAAFDTFTDTGFTLTWEPLYADLSRSGDLGYTYGLYTRSIRTDSSVHRGKYVTIWARQPDGSWKFVLDGGNEGL